MTVRQTAQEWIWSSSVNINSRNTHKTCFENEDLKQIQQRNSTVENIMSKTKDLLDAKIDILLKLETWKITTKQEIQSLRERINTHLDQIQRRNEEAMENSYNQEQKKSYIEENKERGANMQAKKVT
ncbi:hypothetical protein CHS0354_021786 [Potamilus streckersoni]|uniref:Uncharacterized protein n=1 Tax=Potamilus streckersoni TaxID=2493646 RepID=A0AAE0S4D4_9BIVA|nr:hypothetical protein CHS0354_021786 [Potamilus streckersoni]